MSPASIPLDPEDIKRLEGVFALADARGGDLQALARMAGVPVAVAQAAMDDPATAVLLLDAQTAAEEDGRLLKPTAARLTLTMLRQLNAAAGAGELDVDDIGNLLPKVHKVVEHADRAEAARRDPHDGLMVVHFSFVNGGMQITAEAPPAEVVDMPAADVVDVDAAEVPE